MHLLTTTTTTITPQTTLVIFIVMGIQNTQALPSLPNWSDYFTASSTPPNVIGDNEEEDVEEDGRLLMEDASEPRVGFVQVSDHRLNRDWFIFRCLLGI